MIRHISVNGFRALSEFKLDLNHGLNILVGPNGGGKTTIILFFSFLNDLSSVGLATAISNIGGAGNIFRKVGQKNFENLISAKITGSIKLDDDDPRAHPSKKEWRYANSYLYYQYLFDIQLSDDREDVFFKSQELLLRLAKKDMVKPNLVKNWDVRFYKGFNEEGEATSKIEAISENAYSEFDLPEAGKYPNRLRSMSGRETSIIDEYIDEDESLLTVSRLIDINLRMAINQDFGRGLLYNPQPEQIRKPEDSAKTPGIRPDGSGLYATLLAMKRRRRKPLRRSFAMRREVPFYRHFPLSRMVEYFQFAFPALYAVDVSNDPFDNQIRARITLDEKEGMQLPLASLSDGTLKWMSLAAALLTTRHIIGIEEPENFLHPAVQQQALELIREHTRKNSFILVSTHSQSILDAAQPEELIFITLEKSKAVAKRVKNPEHIKELIYESGFGLSFYILSGALQDV